MRVMGYLTQAEYEDEIARPLNVLNKPSLGPAKFPDFFRYRASSITNRISRK